MATERDTLELFLVGIDTTHNELWDSIAAYIVESDWLAAHDRRVENETLNKAAELARSMADNEPDGYYGQACYEVAAAILSGDVTRV